MEENIYFPAVAGVSAGALNGVNYVARQPGRAASINPALPARPALLWPRGRRSTAAACLGCALCCTTSRGEVPFDADTFYNGGQRMIAVATNVQTGKSRLL